MKPINLSFIDKESGKHATLYVENPEELSEEAVLALFEEGLTMLDNHLNK